jgi:hypothetical protein
VRFTWADWCLSLFKFIATTFLALSLSFFLAKFMLFIFLWQDKFVLFNKVHFPSAKIPFNHGFRAILFDRFCFMF